MNPAARDEYLATEVFTAAPQKLQLMLIEAALRIGRRVQLHWQNRQNEAAFNDLIRCQEIVTQLITGLAPNLESPLVRQISSVYAYIYRTLVSASWNRDSQKLSDALKVLEVECETWRQVCERLGTKRPEHDDQNPATGSNRIGPLLVDLQAAAGEPHTGFSCEA